MHTKSSQLVDLAHLLSLRMFRYPTSAIPPSEHKVYTANIEEQIRLAEAELSKSSEGRELLACFPARKITTEL